MTSFIRVLLKYNRHICCYFSIQEMKLLQRPSSLKGNPPSKDCVGRQLGISGPSGVFRKHWCFCPDTRWSPRSLQRRAVCAQSVAVSDACCTTNKVATGRGDGTDANSHVRSASSLVCAVMIPLPLRTVAESS